MNEIHVDPKWGAEQRDHKAFAITQILCHYINFPLEQAECVDIGCGSGGIAFYLAPYVRSIVGVDPEAWMRWKEFQNLRPNLKFFQESVEKLSLADASADLVICNQVYEHVPNPQLLIQEIYRILKPGGYCYFGGPNLLFPIEPHIFWPFVHWLPRRFAIQFMKICGSQAILEANSTNYWRLRRWFAEFEIKNAVPYIIKHPKDYRRSGSFWLVAGWMPSWLIYALTPLSPGFVFMLRKPFHVH